MCTPKSILVIDDDPDILSFCEMTLTRAGYTVYSAINGSAGLAAAEQKKPDLIILDIMMETADSGFRVAETLGKGTPILMLSSIADAANQVFDISSLPIADVAEKPIARDVLVQKVKKLLG